MAGVLELVELKAQAMMARKGVFLLFLCVLALAHFLLALRQPSTHVCVSHPELVSKSFLPTFSSPSLLLQQLLATPAHPSFLLASGVGEVA